MKMKLLSSVTHPHVDPKLYEFVSMEENTTENHWGPSTVWLMTFFKISSFVFSRR